MPWSSVAETSFVQTPEVYKQAMTQAGLTVLNEDNRKEALMEQDVFADADVNFDAIGATGATMLTPVPAGEMRPGVVRVELRARAAQRGG